MNEPKVSVIVPVYKTQIQLVENCVRSITKQTFKEIEILIVNDGNSEDYFFELKRIALSDNRIKIVSHNQNCGLFLSRVDGVKASRGDYLCFVDSDDTITIDWIRMLYNKITASEADLVMGNTICRDENGWNYIRALSYYFTMNPELYGRQVLDSLLLDEGLMYELHTVWNKIYSRKLWDKAIPVFDSVDRCLVMTEDILFSVVLFYYANKMSFLFADGYIYYRNLESSTLNNRNISKLKRDIEDVQFVFNFIESFLEKVKLFDEYKNQLRKFKERYFRYWSATLHIFELHKSEGIDDIKSCFLSFFGKDELVFPIDEDSYFDSVKITWDRTLEELKETIVLEKYKLVSFDLYDTLILRKVLFPSDIYEAMEDAAGNVEFCSEYISNIRECAECKARDSLAQSNNGFEDVTLSDIYTSMEKEFNVTHSQCIELKQLEELTERRIIRERVLFMDLYDLSISLGKKVIITSDMYLEEPLIIDILNDVGIKIFDKLYLSSKNKFLKSSGKLFELIIKDYEGSISPSEMIHIGDNYTSDFVVPERYGIKSVFVPKTSDVLFNNLGDKYTGNAIKKATNCCNEFYNFCFEKHIGSYAQRCIYSTAASILFDNPYVSYAPNTDYNSNPYVLGVLALGPHLIDLAIWLCRESIKNKSSHMVFTSRDGYYIKKAYDVIREKCFIEAPESVYVFLSRKSLIPIQIQTEGIESILSAQAWENHSPMSIYICYQSVLKSLDPKILKAIKDDGYNLEERFCSKQEYVSYIGYLEKYIDANKLSDQVSVCKEYINTHIFDGDSIFDLGYSGKIHSYIQYIVGDNVKGLYLHYSGYDALKRIKKRKLHINCYYSNVPAVSGVINEYIMSDFHPSCVGYERKNGAVQPTFENKEYNAVDRFVLESIQCGAMSFVKTLCDSYDMDSFSLRVQREDASLLYNKFLSQYSPEDRNVFSCSYVEDEYYGGISRKKLIDIWDAQSRYCREEIKKSSNDSTIENIEWEVYKKNVINKSLISKAIFWLIVDKDFFKQRFIDYIMKRQ